MSLNHKNATIPVLSIIIPAHNSEPTLKRTLDSILQGCSVSLLKQIEVLIVENGSTDHTLEVAKNLEKMHSFVKVLISEPKVANARNYGIEHAVGKWLFFLDADDRLVKGALKILLSDTTCTNADMIAYCYYSGETRRQLTKVRIIDSSLLKKAEMIGNPTLYMQVWSKLFRKDVIDRYHIRFDNRLMLSEDSDFTLQFLKECGSLILSDKYIYLYSLNANSIMHTNPQTKLLEYQSAMQITQKKIQTTAPIFQSAFMFYVAMHFNIAMVRGPFDRNQNILFKERIKQMKEALKLSVFRESLNNIKLKSCRSARMLPIAFLKVRLYYAAGCIYSVRARMNHRRDSKAEESNA